MTQIPLWNSRIHDPMLKELHAQGLTDPQIQDEMKKQGVNFSVITIHRHRGLLKLPPNSRTGWESQVVFKDKPNPLHFAKVMLGKRLEEKPSGYWVDGIPANLVSIMRAAHKVHLNMGLSKAWPECWPGEWRS